jgi:hypothetical protein
MNDALILAFIRRLKRRWTEQPLAALSGAEVDEIAAVLKEWKKQK